MEKATNPTTPADLLSLLRIVESTPAGDREWALHCTTQQAVILRLHLPGGGPPRSLEDLTEATGIKMHTDDMPLPGTAFRAHGRWHIHVSAALSRSEQIRQAVHELKHVIDHPLRIGSTGFTKADFEAMADRFADMVCAHDPPRKEEPTP